MFLLRTIRLNRDFDNVRLHLITGPMFSGKTTKLIEYVDNYYLKKKSLISDSIPWSYNSQGKAIIFKYYLDDRYSTTEISTHDKVMRPAISCQSLVPYLNECLDKDIIAIDEGQFFEDLYQFIHQLISLRNTTYKNICTSPLTIIVDSLDGDFLRHPFGQVLDLLPICDSFTKLRTLWKPDNKNTTVQDNLFSIKGAPFSLRTAKSSQVTLIGGEESYKACTRAEYIEQSQSLISIENKDEKHKRPSLTKNGFISVFIGREKSGKTKELIKKLHEIEHYNSNQTESEKKSVIFVSSDLELISQNFVKCKTAQILPSFEELCKFDCILIDDFHYYQKSAELCDNLANNGKYVFVSGITSDENGKIPLEVKLLIPMSESVVFLDENLP